MSILMVLIGATIGAVIGSLFMHWRNDVAKERKQLESKTPYDYALTNAINERDRYQDELRTIQALKRTEADTERIRNEIDTILSDDGEEAVEGTSGLILRCGEEIMNSGGKHFQVVNKRKGTIRFVLSENFDTINTPEYEIESLKAGTADFSTLNAVEYGESIPIQEHADGSAPKAPWDSQITLEEWAGNISKAFASEYGTNVRKDDAKDERLSEDDVERSLINDIKEMASENVELAVEFAKMTVQDDEAIRKQLEETSKELAEEIRDARRRMRKLREEGKYYGETLYRKGNR